MTLVRLLHEVPVGRDPGGRVLLALHRQPPARGVELPLAGAALVDERLAAAGRDLGREQDLAALLVPETLVVDADHEIGPVLRRLGRALGLVDALVQRARAPPHALQQVHVVLVDHARDVALELAVGGAREQRRAARGHEQHRPDQIEGDAAPVAEEPDDLVHGIRGGTRCESTPPRAFALPPASLARE